MDIPQDRLLMFACFLCNEVMGTIFGDEIKTLDPENTYTSFTRDPDAAASEILLYDLTRSAKELRYLYTYLDKDIVDRLVVPEWLDIMAAVCLQILREAA
jgi:hypothetical protein